jgi:hypothetical protein
LKTLEISNRAIQDRVAKDANDESNGTGTALANSSKRVNTNRMEGKGKTEAASAAAGFKHTQ